MSSTPDEKRARARVLREAARSIQEGARYADRGVNRAAELATASSYIHQAQQLEVEADAEEQA